MALKYSIGVLRLQSLRTTQAVRFLSTNTRPEIVQNGAKMADFPGIKAPYVTEIKFLNETSYDPIPIYRVVDNNGEVIDGAEEPKLDNDTLLKMYKTMVQLNQMDKILYESQRQGRISFYMTNTGEEGIQVGTMAALSPEDLVYSQYREAGIFVYRGVTVGEMLDQCYGNDDDRGRGKQMPVHYTAPQQNIVTLSSPLATQIPQAVGAAYAFKRTPNNDRCVLCFFGDGAASEGDAFAAFNFAATLDCPVVFFCRNNGYAISTPTSEQYRGDGIAARGPALGINTVRVDGTDPLAVYNATRRAREIAVGTNKPVLVEAMAYRVGHHSTSDDSSAYRSLEEIDKWNKEQSPIQKLRLYLERKGLWNEDSDKVLQKECRNTVLTAMKDAEMKKKPHYREMLEDVYCEMPDRIQKQIKQLEEHVKKYKEHYPLEQFKSD